MLYEPHTLLQVNFPQIKSDIIQQDIGHKVRTISRFMDTNWKNKVVHLSAIHGTTFGNFIALSPTSKLKSFIAKGNSYSYNASSSLTGEKSPFLFFIYYIYTKESNGWAAQSSLWASQPFISPTLTFFKCLYKILQITKVTHPRKKRAPLGFLGTSSTLQLHLRCFQKC